ncbi:MAG: pantetheine-phosphate adenylyltransferase [Proteobacteria bacterium]|jgi:pantetheine-phosphate adenylyltransferase|nr:pantetheine-phosphate adenylyltransferase [Alphaproteobacteria bacterium]NCC03493.1 pantetheine-phosphate adenylyltransferase [Pseudomonadota bacterium]
MINKFRVGLYPGTFDPITRGHYEVICRATKIVDKLIIGAAVNAGKGPIFDVKTRVKLVEAEIEPLRQKGAQIEVMPFDNLLVHFAKDVGADLIVRGLRAVSDFEYEFQMAGMNHRMCSEVETIFLMATDKHQFISSRFVKEIAFLGGDITPFVSEHVHAALEKKLVTVAARKKISPEVRD